MNVHRFKGDIKHNFRFVLYMHQLQIERFSINLDYTCCTYTCMYAHKHAWISYVILCYIINVYIFMFPAFSRRNSCANQTSLQNDSTSSTDTTPTHTISVPHSLISSSPLYTFGHLTNTHTSYHQASTGGSIATATGTKHLRPSEIIEKYVTHKSSNSSTSGSRVHPLTPTYGIVGTTAGNHASALSSIPYTATNTTTTMSLWSNTGSSNAKFTTPIVQSTGSKVTGPSVDPRGGDSKREYKKLSANFMVSSSILPNQHKKGTPLSMSATSNPGTMILSQQTEVTNAPGHRSPNLIPKNDIKDNSHCTPLQTHDIKSSQPRGDTATPTVHDTKRHPPSDDYTKHILISNSGGVHNQPSASPPSYGPHKGPDIPDGPRSIPKRPPSIPRRPPSPDLSSMCCTNICCILYCLYLHSSKMWYCRNWEILLDEIILFCKIFDVLFFHR